MTKVRRRMSQEERMSQEVGGERARRRKSQGAKEPGGEKARGESARGRNGKKAKKPDTVGELACRLSMNIDVILRPRWTEK